MDSDNRGNRSELLSANISSYLKTIRYWNMAPFITDHPFLSNQKYWNNLKVNKTKVIIRFIGLIKFLVLLAICFVS